MHPWPDLESTRSCIRCVAAAGVRARMRRYQQATPAPFYRTASTFLFFVRVGALICATAEVLIMDIA